MQNQKGRGVSFWAFRKPFDGEYLENGKSERQMSIRALHHAGQRELSKSVSHGAVASIGVPYKQKCPILSIFQQHLS